MSRRIIFAISSLLAFSSLPVLAETVEIPIYAVAPSGQGLSVGNVTLTDTQYGMLITPNLHSILCIS